LITRPNQASNEYSEIDLTEEEQKEALRIAREAKFTAQVKADYWQKITSTNWATATPRTLLDGLLNTRSQTGAEFELTEWNKQTIYSLCMYFGNDSRFNERGKDFSLSKGILLTGPVGVGKTHLMEYFRTNQLCSYITPNCKNIVERFRTDWVRDDMSVIDWYSKNIIADVNHPFGQRELGICFGDLGTESDANSFGNKRNVIEEIIFNRYEAKIPFNRTHYTTNLTPTLIMERYGERIYDRMKEMVNIIPLGSGEKGFR
jgi:hypothetical protein